jgi:hypothetical protein
MKLLGLKDGPVSRFSHEKLGFGKFWRISGEMGLIPPKTRGHPRWPTSVFHTGKEARRGSARLG